MYVMRYVREVSLALSSYAFNVLQFTRSRET